MKLFDGGASVLVIISIVYFAGYLFDKANPPPKQCLIQEEISEGVTVSEWVDCSSVKRGEK
jgi:hypothetical protein